MINKVILEGRLVAEGDLRYTPKGTSATLFRLAVKRPFKDKVTDDYESDFFYCVLYGEKAVRFVEMTCQGSFVSVEGRLNTRSYVSKEGIRVYLCELICQTFHLLETKAMTDDRRARNHQATSQEVPEDMGMYQQYKDIAEQAYQEEFDSMKEREELHY